MGRGPGSSLEFLDFRDYVPGDDLRHVDWRAYARTDSLKVRLFREEVSPLLADRERRATAAACSLVWLELGARLEDRMQDLAARFGRAAPGGISIDLGLRQEELAWLVGASRESVNRELARNRWIRPVARGRYLVRPRLEAVDAS